MGIVLMSSIEKCLEYVDDSDSKLDYELSFCTYVGAKCFEDDCNLGSCDGSVAFGVPANTVYSDEDLGQCSDYEQVSMRGDAGSVGMNGLGSDSFAEYSRSFDCRSLGYRFVKRLFDIVLCLIVFAVVIFLWPLTVALLIATSVSTGGLPFYTQERVGQYGRKFKIIKLRTMIADSDNVEKYLSAEQLEQWKRERKVDNDPRITSFCRLLRATSIDEIPQFINVFLGQMTTIGPRCISESEVAYFGDDAALLLSVPQGITGAWQVGDRNNATFENGTRQAIELDYCRNASLYRDIKVFFATFAVMLVHRTGR